MDHGIRLKQGRGQPEHGNDTDPERAVVGWLLVTPGWPEGRSCSCRGAFTGQRLHTLTGRMERHGGEVLEQQWVDELIRPTDPTQQDTLGGVVQSGSQEKGPARGPAAIWRATRRSTRRPRSAHPAMTRTVLLRDGSRPPSCRSIRRSTSRLTRWPTRRTTRRLTPTHLFIVRCWAGIASHDGWSRSRRNWVWRCSRMPRASQPSQASVCWRG